MSHTSGSSTGIGCLGCGASVVRRARARSRALARARAGLCRVSAGARSGGKGGSMRASARGGAGAAKGRRGWEAPSSALASLHSTPRPRAGRLHARERALRTLRASARFAHVRTRTQGLPPAPARPPCPTARRAVRAAARRGCEEVGRAGDPRAARLRAEGKRGSLSLPQPPPPPPPSPLPALRRGGSLACHVQQSRGEGGGVRPCPRARLGCAAAARRAAASRATRARQRSPVC